MNATRRYTSLHAAFAHAARTAKVNPFVARVCLALHERGGKATSLQIAQDLAGDRSAVRQALLLMYERGLADGKAVDGGPRRPGTVTEVTLTRPGRTIALRVLDHDRHEFALEVAA